MIYSLAADEDSVAVEEVVEPEAEVVPEAEAEVEAEVETDVVEDPITDGAMSATSCVLLLIAAPVIAQLV